MCNVCGNKNENLTLLYREWECDGCGTIQNSDVNAALNLPKCGIAYLNDGMAGTTRTQPCWGLF